jgi:hypothetical protein
MSLSAPSPPNPQATAAAQQGLNTQAAIEQQQINNVNQTNPYGSLTYNQTGTNADGIPIYSATTALNPAEQTLFNTDVGTQTQMAQDASKLATNLGSSLTSAPNLGNSALVNQMMGWQKDYMQPIFNNQNSNLNSQLANQGLAVGSGAYDNAEQQQAMNQNQAYESGMLQDQQTAYNQALQSYEAPIQTLGTLLGESQPGSVTSSLAQTPQENIQPANLESLVQQDYQSQLANYGNTMSGMFSIPSALLGGWARSGFATPSDIRLKRDIARVGRLDDGTPIYRYRYLDKPEMHIGVMAQDIIAGKPDAVVMGDDGFYRVDYERATDASVGAAYG